MCVYVYVNLCVHVWLSVCMDVHVYRYLFMFNCMYVCMLVCRYVCMYVCNYVCIKYNYVFVLYGSMDRWRDGVMDGGIEGMDGEMGEEEGKRKGWMCVCE